MPTYPQLALEAVWRAQFVPDNMTTLLIQPLRTFYNMGPASIGAPGDNNHLYGRHRSPNWDRQSQYCTNRAYGTVDARDHAGDQNWYRAIDTGIQGQLLFDASRRMDALARSGFCPGLAEWFGTFDGQTVVGWYEGHASSSDDSHLYHLHVGLWTQYADDPATLLAIYAAITEDDMTPEQSRIFANQANVISGWSAGLDAVNQTFSDGHIELVPIDGLYNAVAARVNAGGGGGGGTGGATPAQVSAAVRAELDKTRLPSVPGDLELA